MVITWSKFPPSVETREKQYIFMNFEKLDCKCKILGNVKLHMTWGNLF